MGTLEPEHLRTAWERPPAEASLSSSLREELQVRTIRLALYRKREAVWRIRRTVWCFCCRSRRNESRCSESGRQPQSPGTDGSPPPPEAHGFEKAACSPTTSICVRPLKVPLVRVARIELHQLTHPSGWHIHVWSRGVAEPQPSCTQRSAILPTLRRASRTGGRPGSAG